MRQHVPLLRAPQARRLGANWAAVGPGFAADRIEGGRAKACAAGHRRPLAAAAHGFKGRNTIPAMQAAGLAVESAPNRAFGSATAGVCAVLAPGEIILLSGPVRRPGSRQWLEAGWSMDNADGTYLTPRASSHAWFRITGVQAPAMFSKICGIDLRPHKFADLAIAQTSVAKLTGIIIRDDIAGVHAFHLLADSASGEYLWDCVIDAMAEFGGRPAGLAALRELAGPR
jgi:sarcosine oxidase subunit gamma